MVGLEQFSSLKDSFIVHTQNQTQEKMDNHLNNVIRHIHTCMYFLKPVSGTLYIRLIDLS